MSQNAQSHHEPLARGGYRYEIARDESCSVAIVNAVANVVGCDPLGLPVVLSDVVDADALDTLVQPSDPCGPSNPYVEFRYCGCTVGVSPDRSVLVRPAHEEHEEYEEHEEG